LAHFNAGEFFEAHEAWEELWLRALKPEKTFLQGIIQIAAAFHHYVRGNLSGAESLLAAGLTKLEQCPSAYRSVNMAQLRSDARKWAARLTSSSECGQRRPPKIPRMRRSKKTHAKEKAADETIRRFKKPLKSR